ncbi:hypothetical protein ACHAP8_008631 [Fusarium lateritium]
MKRSLLLALWSTGVLGSPCKPSKPSETPIADGTPTESNHISLGLSSTYLDSTKTGQDSEHETSIGTSPNESGQISVSIPFYESDLNSHTQDAVSNTLGLPEGSVTGTGFLPEPTSEGDSLPETSTGDVDSEETSGGTGNSGSPSSSQSDGSSPTGVVVSPVEQSGNVSNPEASGTATSPDDSTNPSGTVSGIPEGSSGLVNTEGSGQPTGTSDVPGDSGNTDVNTATDLPTTIPGGVAGDASGTVANREVSGPSGTATVPGESEVTDSPIGISEGISDGPSTTGTVPGEADTTAPGGGPGDASDTSFSVGDSNPTEVATDGTSDSGPAPSNDSTNTSGSPEETISAPGNPATGTEQGQDTATQTGSATGIDGAQTGTETSVAGPDQPATTAPGNTISDDQGTLTQSNGDEFTSTVPGDVTGAVTTDADGTPTTLPENQDQTTGSPEQSTGVPNDQNSEGNTTETSLGQGDSSTASTTDANAAQPTTEGDDTTTNPVPDNTDVVSTGSSEANNAATTTESGHIETTDSNDVPSTTVPGPSATANPITTAATTANDMPVVTEAPPGLNPSTVSGHPEWTSNTWITTTSEGSDPTVVPVLVGCDDCGGSGSGIILWGFPPVPNTWFQLPGLPKFSFPCIPPASGCTSTPVTEESGEDGDEDEDKSSVTTCTDKQEKLSLQSVKQPAPEHRQDVVSLAQPQHLLLKRADPLEDDAVIKGVWSFADKYQAFMADRFTGNQPHSMNQGVIYAKNKLLAALATDVANAAKIKNIPAGELTSWQKRLANMQDANRAWEVSINFVWAGPTTSKRDTNGLSCDRPNPSLTTESTTEPTTDSTTFATSVRTSSDITTTSEEDVSSTTEQTTTSNNPPPLTDFPTLTQQVPDATISTADGSSCAETATVTNCNVGIGGGHGGPACVERETCNSWVNTKTTSTTPSPTPNLTKPDPGQNEKHCYDSGQKSNYDAITYAAESFCRDVVNDQVQGPVWSNYKLEGKKVPSTGYHFKLAFQVYEGCIWTANYDECMRYKVPIDSCDCSAKGNKQGGWVENNCIMARIDPNSGI